jgi:hypothetical protein
MFVCWKEGFRVATIGSANLRIMQGWGDNYIPFSLTSSKSGWHKGWFYLRNDLEFALPAFTGNSIGQTRSNWTHGPPQVEQEKMLRDHWVVLERL